MLGRSREICFWQLLLTAVMFCGIAVNSAFCEGGAKDYLYYYQRGDFGQARKLSEKSLDDPLARLVFGLCLIHDVKSQDFEKGLEFLKGLYEDKQVSRAIRLEGRLGYVRTVQLIQARGRHPQFDSIDVEKLYLDFIKESESDPKACFAVIYFGEYYCDQYLESGDVKIIQKAVGILESFIAGFEGKEHDLISVHLYVEKLYARFLKDYAKSFEHLEIAYRLGIEHVKVDRNVLFKLGRMSDIKLKNTENAVKYYEEFLRVYPDAIKTPLIKRYLSDLLKEAQ